MLKWLVTKAPSSATSLENIVTDDPLATLNKRKDKNEPIYAVSRVNPIFEEEDAKDLAEEVPKNATETSEAQENSPGNPLDSPPTDRESVRSSGYGSKEADSVSFKSDSPDDEEIQGRISQQDTSKEGQKEVNPLNLGSPGTVGEIRWSFENLSSLGKAAPATKTATTNTVKTATPSLKSNPAIEIITKNPNFVKSIEIGKSSSPLGVILEVSHESEGEESPSSKKSSWPRVSHLAQSLQRQADRIHRRRERERLKQIAAEEVESSNRSQPLRFNPLVSVVTQNRKYVTDIFLCPNSKAEAEARNSDTQKLNNPLGQSHFELGEAHSGIPSSLSASNYLTHEYPLISLQPDSLITEDTLQMMNYPNYGSCSRKSEDLNIANGVAPGDMPNFGRAIYSSFYSSIKSGSSASQESLNSRKERNMPNYSSAKKRGVNAVKDLWEKTGLKTNGRKLLVDVSDLINEEKPTTHARKSYRSSIEDDYRSIPSTSNNSGAHFRRKKDVIRTISGGSSDTYENISSSPHSYEEIFEDERGIDNLGFLDDRGNSMGSVSSSLHSRTGGFGHPFQHTLTDFQRRVSERVHGEPNHRKSWLDVEKGKELSHNESDSRHTSSRSLHKTKESKKNYPGKAVRELGLEGDFKKHEWKGSAGSEYPNRTSGSLWTMGDPNSGSMGKKNRLQIWDQFYGQYKDGSIPGGYFFPHPNSEAPICAHRGGFCHDFTLDPKRSQRMLQKSSREKRHRKCCLGVLVFICLVAFVGTIIGLAWFSTVGHRVSDSM